MISVLLKFLRFILWTKTWSILVNDTCTLQKNVYSAVIGWSVQKCQLNPICWWCSWILPYLCWFCLIFLLIVERGVLKSPTIIMGLSISPYYQFFLHMVALLLYAYTFGIAMSSWWIELFNILSILL